VRVRVDVARAVQAVALAPAPALDGQLPTQSLVVPPEVAALPSIEPPPPTETLRRRRALALFSIEQQRVAVRQQLLQRRLQNLPELEARWRAELRAEYDTDALRAERDAAWQAAFQEYGRARFPLLVALIFAAPESDTHRQIQAQLEQHDRAWQQREQAIESEYQARLARIEQEITVRVNARRREFIRNAESETQEQLAAQPDPAELYLPPPQTLPPAPTRKASLPSLRFNLPARPLDEPLTRPHRRNRTLAPRTGTAVGAGVGAGSRLQAHRRPERARPHGRVHPLPAREVAEHRPQPVLPRRVIAESNRRVAVMPYEVECANQQLARADLRFRQVAVRIARACIDALPDCVEWATQQLGRSQGEVCAEGEQARVEMVRARNRLPERMG
jgi:hypothetical protein